MKYLPIIKYVLFGLSAALVPLFLLMGEASVGTMLVWAYILLGITIVVALLMPLITLIRNPKGALRSLIGLGIVVVVMGVCFALSSAEPVADSTGVHFDDPLTLRLSDTGLYAAYAALAAAVLAILFVELRNAFK